MFQNIMKINYNQTSL